jgi:hypothetical protein
MKPYIYAGSWTQELEDYIEADGDTKPLIEEMFYKFGLKVYARDSSSKKQYLMTLDGLPYCGVYTAYEFSANKQSDELTYFYYSEYYNKDRGRDIQDKRTLRSNKLSKLMQTLEKNKAIMPDHTKLLTRSLIRSAVDMVRSHGKSGGKYIGDLNTVQAQMLLECVLDGRSVSSIPNLETYKVILDKWKLSDETKSLNTKKIDTMFGAELYAIAETRDKGFAIASIKLNEPSGDTYTYDVIKPFQRVLSLDDYEYIDEIRPVLTMYKLAIENEDVSSTRKFELSAINEKYYDDLGIITDYEGSIIGSSFRPLWTFIATEVA